jgi:hypothetical protein
MSTTVDELVKGEFDRLPDQLKPFVLPKYEGTTIYMLPEEMAQSYGKSFVKLAGELLDPGPQQSFLSLPTLFLARHSMELHMKWAIEEFQGLYLLYEYDCAGHDLKEHWNALVSLASSAGIDTHKHSAYVLKLLDYLHRIDPDGFQFRYPHNLIDKEFKLRRNELESVIKAHWHVRTYAAACSEFVADEHGRL